MGELLDNRGRLIVQGVDLHGRGQFRCVDIIIARPVLGHVIEVVRGLGVQPADRKPHISGGLRSSAAALFQRTRAGFHLDFGHQLLRVINALGVELRSPLDHSPVERSRLIQGIGQRHGPGRHIRHRQMLNDRGRLIQRCHRQLFHRRALAVVCIVKPQI